MDVRRGSTLCSFRIPDEDDFLSRRVNLGWDADSTEWNYREDSSDFLSCDYDLLKLFSREHSREHIFEGMQNSRKSSLEKPVGFIMQLKPRTYVCENFKSSYWGKFLSPETRVCDSGQDYQNENSRENNQKTNIEESSDNNRQHSTRDCGERGPVHSALKRSKSVNDVSEDSSCEVIESADQNPRDVSLKQEIKESNSPQTKRATVNKLNKQFSVYSQSFELNSRFIAKSYYHMNYWKQDKSVATYQARNKESLTNSKEPIIDVLIEKRLIYKRNNKRDTEIEEIRRKFNTEKNFRSWVWELETNSLNKLKVHRKTQKNTHYCKQKSGKIPTAKEIPYKKIKTQKTMKNRNTDVMKEETAKKITEQTRQVSQTNGSSTVSLPAILSQNLGAVRRQRSPHKLGRFPGISTDSLMKQYKKQHDEFIKEKNKNKIENNNKKR